MLGDYYGDGFDDYLKQVRSVYPNLDLSKITLDNVVLTTHGVVMLSTKSLMSLLTQRSRTRRTMAWSSPSLFL